MFMCISQVGNHVRDNRDCRSVCLLLVCNCCTSGQFTVAEALRGFSCPPRHWRYFALWTVESCWRNVGSFQSRIQYETWSHVT